jgi:hypothetical protein
MFGVRREITVSRFGNFAFGVFSVNDAAIALQLLGVGHSAGVTTAVSSVRDSFAPLGLFPVHCFAAPRLVASGVGQNKNPIPDMRGTNGRSRYAMPFRIVPDRGQRPENVSQSSSKQRCDVFQHNESWSHLANDADKLKE